jgi:hypothetical protein
MPSGADQADFVLSIGFRPLVGGDEFGMGHGCFHKRRIVGSKDSQE